MFIWSSYLLCELRHRRLIWESIFQTNALANIFWFYFSENAFSDAARTKRPKLILSTSLSYIYKMEIPEMSYGWKSKLPIDLQYMNSWVGQHEPNKSTHLSSFLPSSSKVFKLFHSEFYSTEITRIHRQICKYIQYSLIKISLYTRCVVPCSGPLFPWKANK